MDERQRRVGLNEALFRAVNEQIESLSQRFGMRTDRVEFICECGNADCTDRVHVALHEYLGVREDAARFLIVPGHETLDTEDVVEAHDDYYVVQKREGGPAELARRTEPTR